MHVVQKTYYIDKFYFSKPIEYNDRVMGVANNCSENIDK